ncbi:MAG: hypothetical protein OEZ06_21730 [Myxococcales bacterium]|nr:hypothetical protein [Myxococcales bacterium]
MGLRLSLALGLSAAALLLHCRHYYPFLSDDALISFRYAVRLSEGLGLTFTAGERVEGYSDLLWVLMIAAAHRLATLDPVAIARMLGLASLLSGMAYAIVRLARERGLACGSFFGLAAAGTAPLAVWVVGGLEHGFMAGIAIWTLALLPPEPGSLGQMPRRRIAISSLLAVIVLSRVDGFVLSGAIGVGLLLSLGLTRASAVTIAKIAALPALAGALQLLFRLAYYGRWVPNTATAKVGLNAERLWQGLMQLGDALTTFAVPFILALLALLDAGRRRDLRVAAVAFAGWSSYVALVGGDIFPAYRQLALAFVPLLWLSAYGFSTLTATLAPQRWQAGALLMALVGLHVALGHRDPENIRGRTERWEHLGEPIGTMLAQAFGELQPLLAVDAAGALPYWSGLPTLDMLGLTDRYIADHKPADFGHGGIGHELGDGTYVLSRKPELIAFCGSVGAAEPCFRSGKEMWEAPAFHRDYRRATFQPPAAGTAAILYVRRTDGALALRSESDFIEIPPWQLLDSGKSVIVVDDGRVAARASFHEPSQFDGLNLPAGRWKLEVEAQGDVFATLLCPDPDSMMAARFGSSAVLDVVDDSQLSLVLASRDRQQHLTIHGITLERTDANADLRLDCGAIAGHRLGRNANELMGTTPAGSHWANPNYVVFGAGGVRVDAFPAIIAHELVLSTDANDSYRLDLALVDGSTERSLLTAQPSQSGMIEHVVPLPNLRAPIRWLDITPITGDGRFSVGSVSLR